MEIITTVKGIQNLVLQRRREGKRVGFVPTMGFLHEGHLSLIRKSAEMSDFRVVSIFVNSSQFGPGEDFDNYPRDLERDRKICGDSGAVDVLFCPTPSEMYRENHSVYVDETELSSGLCGASRPGHFRGVATIVLKLFNIVQPDVAVFGQKDAQQVRVIEQMVRDLDCPVEIVVAPIVREADGLAMSSRNRYLSKEERDWAKCLHESLSLAERLYEDGMKKAGAISEQMRGMVGKENDVEAEIEYIEIVDYKTLRPVEVIEDKVLVALAVRVGVARLIDNVVLGS